ncbi:hypothetical protein MHJ94_11925 [Chryseobacterium taklimakanense]|uniref:hypothetical protein n=1 Tax=Chryseobacterium taklimakanense TaxID=536441 RepID=UPI001EF606B9|nr:hypothetical protein [Chryseobacterium taklimakanense]MCG7281997.1 hypothetical protein [Chryseobacterium taklimakanense]
MKEIFQQLLNATTAKEVTDILEILTDDYDINWRAVGDRQNNQSTINMGTDPAAGLVERITNSIDSILDLKWHQEGQPKDIDSPRMAAQKWFDLTEGRLRNIKDASNKKIQELARQTIITLKDSEREDFPTVEIRDFGTGIKGDEFGKTILSLNDNNKIDKLHQLGAYGQGGSTALSFNTFTVIISRPNKILKKGDDVSFTIVRFNDGELGLRKLGWYEYCVGANNNPLSLTVPENEFEAGTLIKHIGMDIGKYTAKLTGPTSSLWYLAHHYMFDTILPFTISGQRKKDLNKGKIENRSVLGNNRRLTLGGGEEKELTQYKRDATLTFRDGKVTLYYWVLTIEGEKPWERIKNYTLPSEPIIITFNGQKQGTLTNSLVKSDLKLPFLEKYLVVQVECDQMDNESKRQLFSSTRETTRDTSIKKELSKLVVDTLDADDELKRLDKERRDRYLRKDETEALDKLRKRLASRINSYLKTGDGGKGVKATDTGETVKPKKQPPIPINDPPTFLEITTPAQKEVFVGKTFSVKFKTDAHPNLFTNPDWFFAVIEPHSFGSYTGSARVVDGYGIAYFKTRENLEPETEAVITLELRPPRQKTISDTVEVISAELPEGTDSGKAGKNNAPNIEIIPISENDQFFKEEGWTKQTVADVKDDKDTVYIYINESNSHLTKLIERAQQYSNQAVESIKYRYREHIGFCAFMISRNKIEERLEAEGKTISIEDVEAIKKADLENSCETVCGMIQDFFDYIRTETEE